MRSCEHPPRLPIAAPLRSRSLLQAQSWRRWEAIKDTLATPAPSICNEQRVGVAVAVMASVVSLAPDQSLPTTIPQKSDLINEIGRQKLDATKQREEQSKGQKAKRRCARTCESNPNRCRGKREPWKIGLVDRCSKHSLVLIATKRTMREVCRQR